MKMRKWVRLGFFKKKDRLKKGLRPSLVMRFEFVMKGEAELCPYRVSNSENSSSFSLFHVLKQFVVCSFIVKTVVFIFKLMNRVTCVTQFSFFDSAKIENVWRYKFTSVFFEDICVWCASDYSK